MSCSRQYASPPVTLAELREEAEEDEQGSGPALFAVPGRLLAALLPPRLLLLVLVLQALNGLPPMFAANSMLWGMCGHSAAATVCSVE